jgi:predicted Zn-dependent protease with MMP-like domain
MQREEFEQLVEEGFLRLPEWVREKIKNVALLIEEEPSVEVRRKERLRRNQTLLGYYQGIPLSVRGENYGVGMTLPDTITLYQLPIEEAAKTSLRDVRPTHREDDAFRAAVRKEVEQTIWHEFAHHFGMNEHEVRERELGKGGDNGLQEK